jgi:hypothetical protein
MRRKAAADSQVTVRALAKQQSRQSSRSSRAAGESREQQEQRSRRSSRRSREQQRRSSSRRISKSGYNIKFIIFGFSSVISC